MRPTVEDERDVSPLVGMGSVSGALPAFTSLMVFGLSLLVEPTAVEQYHLCDPHGEFRLQSIGLELKSF